MLGRIRYQFQKTFKDGISAAWYRDVVRSRILKTKPVPGTKDKTCEIHVLTSNDDWLNLVWTLKSFYLASGKKYALTIHDDGTLTTEAKSKLKSLFPDSKFIERSDADVAVEQFLERFPRCREFRRTNPLAPKLFDFLYYLESDRMFLLDSDVLFFDEPTKLIQRLEDKNYNFNSVNADVDTSYTVDHTTIPKRCGFEMIERFNSGLGLIHRDSLNLEWLEEFLGLSDIVGHFWRIEQTLFALCSCRFGVELLPSEYDVFLEGNVEHRPSRHYVGVIRGRMYGEGIKKLHKSILE